MKYAGEMALIDPHTHTLESDGTDTPTELMQNAAKAGLDVVGLTDHDVTHGWDEATAAVSETGVSLLRGMEMSCAWNGITVHLLSYLHDPRNDALLAAARKTIDSRENRARIMVERLSVDYPITWEDVLNFAPEDGAVGRPHIADALIAAGAFENRNQAFEWALHPRGPYYYHHWAQDPIVAVQQVRAAGGVPIIAHPRARMRQKLLPIRVLMGMIDAGLAGIEANHPDHAARDVKFLREISAERGLLVTGSSDYHGTGKPNWLGQNTTPAEVIQEIEHQGTLEIVRP